MNKETTEKTDACAGGRVRGQRGAALVIVLALLVIVLGLTVGFLTRVRTERQATTLSVSSTSSRLLADTAVTLVQAQISDATSLGENVAWTSQPGMIRTFATAALAASSDPFRQYKLYSSDTMISTISGTSLLTADRPPSDWSTQTAHWADLNAPVIMASGSARYPIIDPAAQGNIDGFSINATTTPGATTAQPAPMPVRWLYVLESGSVVAATGNGTVASVAGADPKTNPIVGRIAFWTDDETCKVNVNTASEETYWDTPRTYSPEDSSATSFGLCQPAQKEFQAYPGHPATTSLSPIFFPGNATVTLAQRNDIYSVVPKIQGGGSDGGTRIAPEFASKGILALDNDRLFASVDELLFAFGGRASMSGTAGITQDKVRQSGFFLTANSVAPDTNLFNLPRVSMWPLFQLQGGSPGVPSPTRTTAFDRLAAFCSTINKVPYYFQRYDPDSSTNDYDNIPDNKDLFAYLQSLTSRDIPGFGGKFSTKYGGDRDQILTEMFDYIRSTNLYDDNLSALPDSGFQYTKGRQQAGVYIAKPGHGQVVPIQIGTNRGFGRYVTVSEIALNFICTGDQANPDSNVVTGNLTNTTLGGVLLTPGQRRMQTLFLTELFSPMAGWVLLGEDFNIKVTGLENLTVNGQSLFSQYNPGTQPAPLRTYIWNSNEAIYGVQAQGGTVGFDLPLLTHASPPPGYPSNKNYPFLGGNLTVTGNTMNFAQTGPAFIEIQTVAGVTVQTINFNFPNATFPVPSLSGAAPTLWSFAYGGNGLSGAGRADTIAGTNASGIFWGKYYMQGTDVVKSIIPNHGDYRLVALQKTVPDTVFQPHGTYYDSAKPRSHSLSSFRDADFNTSMKTVAPLVSGESYYEIWNRIPDFPDPSWTGFSKAANARTNGDWDAGNGFYPDGPFVNKPDEGNTQGLASTPPINPYFANNIQLGTGQTFFSPNRQVASPVAFGSLSSGLIADEPWRTLLFRPQAGHFGATSPPDHLLLDLFWMPVVEPYAISQPFATAGKINMNYQILPFTYLTRNTGIYSLLKNERIMAVPNGAAATYKKSGNATNYRQAIDVPKTLEQFDAKFSLGDVFRSASEICGLELVVPGQTAANMPAFWDLNKMTGENVREGAYGRIYPRLTTKSNTYTVHYMVQALKQGINAPAGQWDENRGSIVGEYRGSTVIERYIDPNDSRVPDYRKNPAATPGLSSLYRWRVVSQRQFQP